MIVIDDNLVIEKVLNVDSGFVVNEVLVINKFEYLLYISISKGLSVYNVKMGNMSYSFII